MLKRIKGYVKGRSSTDGHADSEPGSPTATTDQAAGYAVKIPPPVKSEQCKDKRNCTSKGCKNELPEALVDDWEKNNKPLKFTGLSEEVIKLEVKMPNGAIMIVKTRQTETPADVRRRIGRKMGMTSEAIDRYQLFYYECWMGEEFALNHFGIPWNGTCLELREKEKPASAGHIRLTEAVKARVDAQECLAKVDAQSTCSESTKPSRTSRNSLTSTSSSKMSI